MMLPNGFWLHHIAFPERIELLPGHKIKGYHIYDVVYSERPEVLTKVYYISTDADAFSEDKKTDFDLKTNILSDMAKQPDVVVCSQKSLPALFFYFKRFYQRGAHKPIIVVQTNSLLPFHAAPSQILLPELPSHVIAAVPYFEDLGIPSRIASDVLEMPGWYEGELAVLLKEKYQYLINI